MIMEVESRECKTEALVSNACEKIVAILEAKKREIEGKVNSMKETETMLMGMGGGIAKNSQSEINYINSLIVKVEERDCVTLEKFIRKPYPGLKFTSEELEALEDFLGVTVSG